MASVAQVEEVARPCGGGTTSHKQALAPALATEARDGERLAGLAWSHSREASNDFRSDTLTKPTLPMLEAIITASLGDADLEEDTTTAAFEAYVAGLVGHEAALLVMSGTMGNQVALRAALGAPPCAILADHRGHIANYEGGGASAVSGALIKTVVPANGHHLTLRDVQAHAVQSDVVFYCPTRVVSLENTLAGTVMPLAEMRAIAAWARAQAPPIHVHLDGARAWEAMAAGAFTPRELGGCADTLQLCLTKGLGAPVGSVVTGSAALIRRARWARKLLGGSTRASGVLAAPARVAIDDVFLGGKLRAAQARARAASDLWEQLGGRLAAPTETNMLWFDLAASGLAPDDFYPLAAQFDIRIGMPLYGRIVFHYQITDDAFARLCDFFRAVLKNRPVAGGRA